MNILITGGAGFIGSHTYVVLKEHGYTPIIVDDFSNSSESVLEKLAKICPGEVLYLQANVNDPAT
jgi:UDP-glucose 4-epimerase